MKILLDNTSCHSILRALTGTNNDENDLKNLLSYCTELIFCDKIYSPDSNTKGIESSTTRLKQIFSTVGLAKNIFETLPLSDKNFEKACKYAIDSYAIEIGSSFKYQKLILEEINKQRPSLNEVENRNFNLLHRLLKNGEEKEIIDWGQENEEGKLVVGSSVYVLSQSPEFLKELINNSTTKDNWGISDTSQMISNIRMFMHDYSASLNNSHLSPSITRVKNFTNRANLLSKRVNSILKVNPDELYSNVGLPPIDITLINRSKGDLERLLDVVLELREKAKPLRKYINKKEKYDPYYLETYQANKDFQELRTEFIESNEISEKITFWNAISKIKIFPIPTLELEVGNLAKWIEKRKKKKRIRILTNLSSEIVYQSSLNRYFQLLKKNKLYSL